MYVTIVCNSSSLHNSKPRGLLSAHIFAADLAASGQMYWYNGELLDLARDLGDRLLPAFNTSTGIPYPKVTILSLPSHNLRCSFTTTVFIYRSENNLKIINLNDLIPLYEIVKFWCIHNAYYCSVILYDVNKVVRAIHIHLTTRYRCNTV